MNIQEYWFNKYVRVLEIKCKEKYLYSIDLYAECSGEPTGDKIGIGNINVIYEGRRKLSLSSGKEIDYCIVYVKTREAIQAVNARLWSRDKLCESEIKEAGEAIRRELRKINCKVII